HRHRNADPPRRTNQNFLRGNAELLRCDLRHQLRVGESARAGAGIRVAGIHHDGARAFPGGASRAHFHRSGADLIRREHSRDRGRNLGNNQREIRLLTFLRTFARADSLDVAKDGGGFETSWRANGPFDFSKRIFQSSPAVSSNPHKMLKHWIAWPLAPLRRLSSALITISRPVRGSSRHAISMKFEPTTFFVSGRVFSSSKRTNGSFA